jgi:hypothetical protein
MRVAEKLDWKGLINGIKSESRWFHYTDTLPYLGKSLATVSPVTEKYTK